MAPECQTGLMLQCFKAITLMMKFTFLFFLLISTNLLAAEVLPDKTFKTIQTPHFEIIVDAKQQELGTWIGLKLETSFGLLSEFFSDSPEKTIVVINDKTDVTNGYATPIPYPHIMIFPALPGPTESLGEMGDWALELLSHEYTHILTFEPANGTIKYLRPVFGSIIAPNILLPRWWLEGIAVYAETRVGTRGRLRSKYQESVVRSMVLDETWGSYDIAQANEVLPTWPEGMRPYLFGSLLWDQMSKDKGEGILNQLSQRHGGRVPYFIETPARDHLDMTYPAQYGRMKSIVEEKAQKQIQQIKSLSPTTSIGLTLKTQYSSGPTISPNGKYMSFISVDEVDKRSIRILERNEKDSFLSAKERKAFDGLQEAITPTKILDGPPTGSILRVSWHPQSTQIVFDKLDEVNSTEFYSDLYTLDVNSGRIDRLTRSLRAREPAFTPNGQKIIFIQLGAFTTSLASYDITSKAVEILYKFEKGERAAFPVALNDNEILFSLRKNEGQENLYVYSVTQKSISMVLEKFKDARLPVLTEDGFYFVSTNNGVFNIYWSSNDFKKTRPVTNTLLSYSTLAYDPLLKDIYATAMTSKGPQIQFINSKELVPPGKELPAVTPLFEERKNSLRINSSENLTTQASESWPTEDYKAASYLLPRYWIPFIATSQDGIVFQALTSGFDPLKKHVYNIGVLWDSAINRVSFEGSYLNNSFSTSYMLQSYETNSYLISATDIVTNTGASLAAIPDLWSWNRYLSGGLSWKYLSTSYAGLQVKRTGPSVSLSYRNISKSGEQISPEAGKSVYFSAVNYLQQENYFSHSQYGLGGSYFFSRWLPPRHALAFKIQGLYTPEDISSILGASTNSISLKPDGHEYIMRGYLNGHFLGRTVVNTQIEYRFPLKNIYRGSGTDPFYFKRIYGAIIADGVAVEGLAYRGPDKIFESVNTNQNFWNIGAEAHLDTTLGYVLPLTLVYGFYFPLNPAYAQGIQSGLSIQMNSIF